VTAELDVYAAEAAEGRKVAAVKPSDMFCMGAYRWPIFVAIVNFVKNWSIFIQIYIPTIPVDFQILPSKI
jgi:hypothetical protein